MLSDIKKRILLFLFGCITVRVLFAVVAKQINPDYLPILGLLALLPAIGFAYLWVSQKRQTGPEVFGDKIWWTNLRPIHSLLYFAFAISALMKKSYAWVFLAIDVIFGLTSFIVFHHRNGDFKAAF